MGGLSILEPLANFITVSVTLSGLKKEETFSYIEQRLQATGSNTALFTKNALSLMPLPGFCGQYTALPMGLCSMSGMPSLLLDKRIRFPLACCIIRMHIYVSVLDVLYLISVFKNIHP